MVSLYFAVAPQHLPNVPKSAVPLYEDSGDVVNRMFIPVILEAIEPHSWMIRMDPFAQHNPEHLPVLQAYEDTLLLGAMLAKSTHVRQLEKAGSITRLLPTEDPWKFKISFPPCSRRTEKAAAARLQNWKEHGLFQIGETATSLRRLQWSATNVKVEPNGAVRATIEPFGARNPGIRKQLTDWGLHQHEAAEQMETDDPNSSERSELLWIQPSTFRTGFEHRINALRQRSISRQIGSPSRQSEILSQLVGRSRAENQPKIVRATEEINGTRLNPEQNLSVTTFLHERCLALFQQAPAGTGKTFTSAAIVNELLRRNQTTLVLVLAPTNNAVRNAAETIATMVPEIRRKMMILPSMHDGLQTASRGNDALHPHYLAPTLNRLLYQLRMTKADSEFVSDYLNPDSKEHNQERAIRTALAYGEINVICCTTAVAEMQLAAFREKLRHVLLDEAGQVPFAQLLTLVSRTPQLEKLFITGDKKQLSTYTAGLSPETVRCGHESVIEVINRRKSMFTVELKISYRFHPFLAYCLAPIYDGQLRPGRNPQSRNVLTNSSFTLPTPEIPLVLLHSSYPDRQVANKSSENLFQRAAADGIATHLRKVLPDEATITVLCYYKAEQQLLRADLPTSIEVTTIDGFQGRERDVIILVTTKSPRNIRFTHPENTIKDFRFALSDERATVALTRARHGLIIIGNFPFLSQSPVWSAFIRRALTKTPILDSEATGFIHNLDNADDLRRHTADIALNDNWLQKLGMRTFLVEEDVVRSDEEREQMEEDLAH